MADRNKIYLLVSEPIPPCHYRDNDTVHDYYTSLEAACIALLQQMLCHNWEHLRVDVVTLKESPSDAKVPTQQIYLPQKSIDSWPKRVAEVWKASLCQQKIEYYAQSWSRLLDKEIYEENAEKENKEKEKQEEDDEYGPIWKSDSGPVSEPDRQRRIAKSKAALLKHMGKYAGFWDLLGTTPQHVVEMAERLLFAKSE